jgi:predicted nucleic acid-binding Zn ribbon protein
MNRHNDKSIKDVLQEYIITNDKISKGFHMSKMDKIWRSTMGTMIAGYTRKVYYADGLLKVYLDSAPLKKELIMGKDKVIALINESLGSSVVKDIEIY